MHIEAPKCIQIQNLFVGEKKVSMGQQQKVQKPHVKTSKVKTWLDWANPIVHISIYLVKKEGSLFVLLCLSHWEISQTMASPALALPFESPQWVVERSPEYIRHVMQELLNIEPFSNWILN
jgi:hypothetical protein